jgi:copper chaperone CopZ
MSTTNQHATSTLSVQGMTCGSCEQRVHRALEGLPGVESARVSRSAGQATVTYNPSAVTPGAMAEALGDAGYPAALLTTRRARQPSPRTPAR